MKVHFIAVSPYGLVLGAQAGAVDLTAKNFDAEVLESGKSAFVKFLAPWYVPEARHARRSEKRDRAAAVVPVKESTFAGVSFGVFFFVFREKSASSKRAVFSRAAESSRRRERSPRPFRSPSLTSRRSPARPQVRPLQVDEAGLGQTRRRVQEFQDRAHRRRGLHEGAGAVPEVRRAGLPHHQVLHRRHRGDRRRGQWRARLRRALGLGQGQPRPSCGAENIDLCDADQKAAIQAKQKLSDAELDAEITAVEAELKAADTELEELLKSLQSQYEEGKKKKDDTIAAKSPGLTLLRSVKRRQGVGQV